MADRALFDKPAAEPVQLSKALPAFEYRLAKDETAQWTEVKLKTYLPCEECAHLQHELGGDTRPRRQSKRRRRHPMGPTLELCHAHAKLWEARDEADSGLARTTKRRAT